MAKRSGKLLASRDFPPDVVDIDDLEPHVQVRFLENPKPKPDPVEEVDVLEPQVQVRFSTAEPLSLNHYRSKSYIFHAMNHYRSKSYVFHAMKPQMSGDCRRRRADWSNWTLNPKPQTLNP
jgi:hypothetical protein